MTEPLLDVAAARTVRALVDTAAALVRPYDVVGITSRLLLGAARATGAAAGGLILRRAGEPHLEVLAATSHRAEDVELYQVQLEQGPCFEAVETGEPATAETEAQIRARWPELADGFASAGYRSAHATPLFWNGTAIGALNLFWAIEQRHEHMDTDVARAFADLAAVAIVHAGPVADTLLEQRTRDALNERTIIEQAKGVLAYQHDIHLDAAFSMLLTSAERDGDLLTRTAARVVEQAARGEVSDLPGVVG